MTLLDRIAAELATGAPDRLSLPEYRQIELYTKRKTLEFADRPDDLPLGLLAGAVRAFMLLDGLLAARESEAEATGAARDSWRFYEALPRERPVDKLVSQLYRILRIARLVLFHRHGRVEVDEGIVKINGFVGQTALSLEITPAGLRLVASAVAYWARSRIEPYPEAYVAAMLGEYFFDIVAEIRRFADEDRILYQFRRAKPFGRHFRFDCDNPKTRDVGDAIEFDIGPLYRDAARHPIDFYVMVDDALHIVPVEMLANGRIARTELPRWKAVLADGRSLPASFRARFGREVMVVGQPMT